MKGGVGLLKCIPILFRGKGALFLGDQYFKNYLLKETKVTGSK